MSLCCSMRVMNSSAAVSIRLAGGASPAAEHQVEAMAQHAAGGRHDPAGRDQVAQGQPVMPSSGWPARHGAHGFLGQRLVAQVGLVVLGEQACHQDVELALLQPLDQHRAGLDLQRDAQAGLLRLTSATAAAAAPARGGDGADPDLAEAPGLERAEFVVGLVQAGEHHARVADHGFAVPGRLACRAAGGRTASPPARPPVP